MSQPVPPASPPLSPRLSPPTYPNAVAPERTHAVASFGLKLRVHEWGDPNGEPILLFHGMFDHARGFDLLAPLLSERYRVVSLDARGHGDSDWAESYSWPSEIADLVNVMRWLGKPSHLLGHSKGGGQVIDAAIAAPELTRAIVNLDGFGPPPVDGDSPRPSRLDAESTPERFAQFLDLRRDLVKRRAWRAYATFEELVARRSSQNPTLSHDWLRYFLYHGAREHPDGWRWKVDPLASMGFGPWRPDWVDGSYKQLAAPMLAIIGSIPDTWGPLPEDVLERRLRHVRDLERATVEGAGHFIHMEKPSETAQLALDFLADR
jgi:pimeloyl-ACP methyl ester carboxylesterase